MGEIVSIWFNVFTESFDLDTFSPCFSIVEKGKIESNLIFGKKSSANRYLLSMGISATHCVVELTEFY